MNSVYERMVQRYAEGNVPWDADLPPPEVLEIEKVLKPGTMLDIGCGFGRASIYLGSMGWRVDGIDFVGAAVEEARRRADAAGVKNATFYQASATELSFLTGPYDLALDVGCTHSLEKAELLDFWRELERLLPVGATFLWFLRLRDEAGPIEDGGPRGIPIDWVRLLGLHGFQLQREELGHSVLPNGSSWASGWFWFVRQ